MLLKSVALSAIVKSEETSGAMAVKSSYNIGEEDLLPSGRAASS